MGVFAFIVSDVLLQFEIPPDRLGSYDDNRECQADASSAATEDAQDVCGEAENSPR